VSEVATMPALVSAVAAGTAILQNLVLAGCAVATVIIAAMGLSAWRKQLKGTSEYAKAKEVLKAVYKVGRGFAQVRAPAVYQYEYPEDMADFGGHLKKEHDYEGTAYVYENRWKPLGEAFRELEDLNLDAQVEWGRDFADAIVPLRKCVIELQIAIQTMLERKKDPEDWRATTAEEKAANRGILYDLGKDSKYDTFTPQIDAAIQVLEDKLRPHIAK